MAQSVARVLGCNAPSAFAVHAGRVFVLADNGVVIAENGSEHLWLPFAVGKYAIDRIAVSSTGVMCLTERRLQVALHFFDAATLQSFGSTDTQIPVSVVDIAFAADGGELFVVAAAPEVSVMVFRRTARGGTYALACSVPLQGGEYPKLLLPGSGGDASVRFALCYTNQIVGYGKEDGGKGMQRCFCIDAEAAAACASGPGSICYVSATGTVHTYAHDTQTHREVCDGQLAASAAAAVVHDGVAAIVTRDGELVSVQLSDGTRSRRELRYTPSRDAVAKVAERAGELLLSTSRGLVAVPITPGHGDAAGVRVVKGWAEPATLKCLSVNGGTSAAWVLRDGSVAVCEAGCVKVVVAGGAEHAAVHACVLHVSRIVILYRDATLRCFDCHDGREVWTHRCADWTPSFVEADEAGNVAVCGTDAVRFLRCVGDAVEDRGVVHAALLASISLARWIPSEESILTVCENGDAFLIEVPAEGEESTTHAAESLVRNSWRFDFPITDALVCYATSDTLNLLVHSADHDSKVYTLDRLHEGDAKVSRPLFLIHDHSSGGSCLMRLSDTIIISCGRDGSIAARDVTPYQTQMTPIPPSREKRRPLWLHAVRSSFRGGITTAAVSAGGDEVVCGGDDPVLQCVALAAQSTQATWREPLWTHVEVAQAARVGTAATAVQADTAAPERDALQRSLDRVREQWTRAMSDKDAEVPLEAFLTPDQRGAFAAECDNAVFDMRERHYYHAILNEYLQDTIKKRCSEAMEVPRVKVVSMASQELEVHNFHIHRKTRAEAGLARKALFLRRLQKKMATGRRTSPDLQLVNDAAPQAADGAKGTADTDAAMLNDADVYTQCRMVLQSLLVKGRALALKEDFNGRFGDLQDLKRQSVALVDERTLRCVNIGKQLGDLPAPLFTAVVDPEENPNSLFVVQDSELSAEAQALVAPSKGACIVSPIDEAALHLWMDGLEKEVRRLEVHVPLPDFADETRDAFVPAEERTEEQARVMEAYTKRLKEENDRVEAKKEALRGEFAALQDKNRETAAKLDERIRLVRQWRVNTVEQVDETDVHLALLHQHRLSVEAAHRQHRSLAQEREGLRDGLVQAASAVVRQKRQLTAAEAELAEAQSQMEGYATSASALAPFDEGAAGEKLHRRFVRWLRRFEDGKAPLPDTAAPPGECTPEQWEAFCEHCQTVAELQELALAAAAAVRQATEDVLEAQRRCDAIGQQIGEAGAQMDAVRAGAMTRLLDVPALCRLHQGQIQDEGAATATAFASSNLRWRDDVTQYNDLILQSDAESHAILGKVFVRRKLMKLLEWEGERLKYCAGTLQLELRQLHTLRVTRQMQEWLSGDTDLSEEKTLASIQRHMDLVDSSMNRKAEELRAVVRRLKSQIAERVTENTLVGAQCDNLDDTVRANAAVYSLIETRADGTPASSSRAKEIFVTSELEELARSQQEELVRLKREVDRLRERTFPSFAVVSKQTR